MTVITGRHETMVKTERYISTMLEGLPDVCKDFYYNKVNCSHTTKKTYIQGIKNFFTEYKGINGIEVLSNNDVFQIMSSDIDQYFSNRKLNNATLSDTTIATQMSALTTFFEFLKKQGYISENPMGKASGRPSVQAKESVVYLENEEVQQVLDNIEKGVGTHRAQKFQEKWKSRDRLLFMICLSTGIRVSALDEINVDNIDLQKRTLKVIEKGAKEREFDLEDIVFQMMCQWLKERSEMLEQEGCQECKALFISKYQGKYKRITIRAIQKIVSRYTQDIGKKITPHKLRSTYGTMVYRETGDIYFTAKQLGHSSTDATQRYAEPDKKQTRKVNKAVVSNMFQK